MSAAQLVDAYRFPSVNAFDEPDFRPEQLLEGGTLYVVSPESEQDLLAPIVGGLLGSVLRAWEQRAAANPRHGGPPLRILADEAAHLAPLGKLPTYLAVSAGWGVRWCLVYQSLSQLEHRYGREADAVLGNSLCKLILGPIQDESTRRYLSELLDEETVTASSWSSSPLGNGGRATRHELRSLAVRSREAKLPRTRAELDGAWRGVAAEHGLDEPPQSGRPGAGEPAVEDWSARVLEAATSKRAVFDERELRCVGLEHAAGAGP